MDYAEVLAGHNAFELETHIRIVGEFCGLVRRMEVKPSGILCWQLCAKCTGVTTIIIIIICNWKKRGVQAALYAIRHSVRTDGGKEEENSGTRRR